MGDANERRSRASGTTRPQGRGYLSGSDLDFIRLELTAEEKTALRSWRSNAETLFETLDEMIEGGYRVTLKYDDYNKSAACFLFPDVDSDNAGRCLTGRGSTVYNALSQAVFKHSVILRGEWARLDSLPGRGEPDDD